MSSDMLGVLLLLSVSLMISSSIAHFAFIALFYESNLILISLNSPFYFYRWSLTKEYSFSSLSCSFYMWETIASSSSIFFLSRSCWDFLLRSTKALNKSSPFDSLSSFWLPLKLINTIIIVINIKKIWRWERYWVE